MGWPAGPALAARAAGLDPRKSFSYADSHCTMLLSILSHYSCCIPFPGNLEFSSFLLFIASSYCQLPTAY
jgi:hypothetical protein